MSPSTAALLFAAGVVGLFYLDRGRAAGVTGALWLPTLWLLLIASKPPSFWLGLGPTNPTPQQIMAGNPLDAVIFGILLILALGVVWRRRAQVGPALRLAWPVVLYFGYCLISCAWSAYPGISTKRWVKSLGDLAMALIVATEPDIAAALRKLVSRCGFVLLPASVVLIKYYPGLGRAFSVWTGAPENDGVALTKNMLGVIAFVLTLGAFWSILHLFRDPARPHRRRHLIAQLTLLAFGVDVLTVSHSSTSGVSFALGAVLLLIAGRKVFARRPRAIHVVVVGILVCGGLAFWLGGEGAITHDLGRKSNLTGRTEIWAGVLQVAARQPVLGAGFESFWTGQNLLTVWRHLPLGETVNESHDGYIEVYAQLGLVGLAIMAWLLLSAYRRAAAAYAAEPEAGRLLVGYVAALLVYNITEAGFRMLDPAWLFLLLAFTCAAAIVSRKGAALDAGQSGGPGERGPIRTVQALRA